MKQRLDINSILSKATNAKSSAYVNAERRSYSLYVLEHRAICALTDGLKAAGRRVLWMARDGKKYKSASLAGNTLCIHPHDLPTSAIDTLAGKYINNICLFNGEGAFGTRLMPKGAFGAARYTTVSVSAFCKDVMFADIDLIPMKENYDMSLKEPVHFLPLVPITMVNPSDGITIGFASTILPRSLEDIISDQINVLNGKNFKEKPPTITFFEHPQQADNVDGRWAFHGKFEIQNKSTILVTDLPYGVDHPSFISHLDKLIEKDVIKDYVDQSAGQISITIKTPLSFDAAEAEKTLKLVSAENENITLIGLDHKTVQMPTYKEIVEQFTNWRLKWFYNRFEKQICQLEVELVRHQDVVTAAKANITKKLPEFASKVELCDWLKTLKITNIDYVASLPTYRFTKGEIIATQKMCEEIQGDLDALETLIHDPLAVKAVYIGELKEILANYKKGKYDTKE